MALPARWTVVGDRRVADLAGRSGRSVVQIAIDEERAADARAHRDEQEMACAAPGACLQLGMPRSGRVMTDDLRTLDPFREQRRGGDLGPTSHVRRVVD